MARRRAVFSGFVLALTIGLSVFTVEASTSGPVAFVPPQNPYLAPNGRGHPHNDSYQTDTYSWAGPAEAPAATALAPFPGWCAPPKFDGAGRAFTACQTEAGPQLVLLDPFTMATLATLALPSGTGTQATVAGGYSYLDQTDRLIVATLNRQIWVVRAKDGPSGVTLTRVKKINLAGVISRKDHPFAVTPDWNGRAWFVSEQGRVGWVNLVTGAIQVLILNERMSNAPTIDETGGVYVVTVQALYRLDLDPTSGAPTVTWREPYDRGVRVKPGQEDKGSGTSPALMGTDHVAIADNADPNLHALIYQRATTVEGSRLVCAVPLFGNYQGATNNSFAVTDTSLIVENNYGYVDASSVSDGKTTAPGISRVDLDPSSGSCTVAWTNPRSAPPADGKLALGDGRFYAYTKIADPDGHTDPWTVSAIDFATGETVYDALVGYGSGYDAHPGALVVSPAGVVWIGVQAGMMRLG